MKITKEDKKCSWVWIENEDISGWGLDCGCFSDKPLEEYDDPQKYPDVSWEYCPYCGLKIQSEINPIFKNYYRFLVTGGGSGIGKAFVEYAMKKSSKHTHIQIDVVDNISEPCYEYPSIDHEDFYSITYHQEDINDYHPIILPAKDEEFFLINNAGIQGDEEPHINIDVFYTNLISLMEYTNIYAFKNPQIKAVVNLASVSAHNGAEFPSYTASKGGVLAYTKYAAKRLATKNATCNSLSFGGVITSLNNKVMYDDTKWSKIMEQTPLSKWMTAEEAAKWIWFVAVENQSMTGQDIIVDNGEMINHKFIW